MPVNPEFNNMREGANNLRLIKKYMNILEANYNRKREETIKAIQAAGYTPEDIKKIKERYCGSTTVTLNFGYTHLDEMKEIVEKLKAINGKVIYDGERSVQVNQMTSRKGTTVEHVETEIVPEGELEEMRRRQEDMKAQRDTDKMRRMVNEHSDRAREEQAAYTSSGTRSQDFRKKVADMAGNKMGSKIAETSQGTGQRDVRYSSRGGKRVSSDRTASGRKSRPGSHLPKRNLKNKPKTLDMRSLIRRLAAGALAVSLLAGAYLIHKNNEYEEDVKNRIEYVDSIIDRNGKAHEYRTLCGIDFTGEELDRFIEVAGKIDSYVGRESTELSVVDIITTAGEFEDFYKDIVKERLEEGFGYSIEDNEIEVARGRENLEGHPGDYNGNGYISKIGYMKHINDKNIPKELRNSVIAAFGGQGIEKPAISVEELIYKLDNQEITKAEACEYLSAMLDDAKELMTRQYEEKGYGELEETESTYSIVKEKESEQAKNVVRAVDDNELDR